MSAVEFFDGADENILDSGEPPVRAEPDDEDDAVVLRDAGAPLMLAGWTAWPTAYKIGRVALELDRLNPSARPHVRGRVSKPVPSSRAIAIPLPRGPTEPLWKQALARRARAQAATSALRAMREEAPPAADDLPDEPPPLILSGDAHVAYQAREAKRRGKRRTERRKAQKQAEVERRKRQAEAVARTKSANRTRAASAGPA